MARQFLTHLIDSACFHMNLNDRGEDFMEGDGEYELIVQREILDDDKLFSDTKFAKYLHDADEKELRKVFAELENYGMSLPYLWENLEIDKDDLPLAHLMIGYKIRDGEIFSYEDLFNLT